MKLKSLIPTSTINKIYLALGIFLISLTLINILSEKSDEIKNLGEISSSDCEYVSAEIIDGKTYKYCHIDDNKIPLTLLN